MFSNALRILLILSVLYSQHLWAADSDLAVTNDLLAVSHNLSSAVGTSAAGQASISVVIPFRVDQVRKNIAIGAEQDEMISFYVEKRERILSADDLNTNHKSGLGVDRREGSFLKKFTRIRTEIFYPL